MSPYASLSFSVFATLLAALVLIVRWPELVEQWSMAVVFVLLTLNTGFLWKKRNQDANHD